MTDILDDYREWSAAQPERLSTHSNGCHMWHPHCMASRLAAALEATRPTDAEREALERACCSLGGVIDMSAECSTWDAEARQTLLSLLDRWDHLTALHNEGNDDGPAAWRS